MSLSFKHVAWVLAVWFAATSWFSQACAQGTLRPRRALELTETNSAEILTNLNLLNTKKEGVSELDEQLKALKKFSPDLIFEGNWYAPRVPQPGSRLSTKALNELLQRQNNWGLTPEDLGRTSNTKLDSDTLSLYGDNKAFSAYGDDKAGKNTQSSLRQFYDALNNRTPDQQKQDGSKRLDLDNISQSKRVDSHRDFDSDEDSNLPDGVRDKAKKLREMVTEDSSSIFNPTRAPSSFDNFFGLRDETSTREQLDPKKEGSDSFIDQFKKTLDKQSAASSLAPGVSGMLPNTDPASRMALVPGLEPFAASIHHDSLGTAAGSTTSLVDPTAMRDLNSSALNQWNSMYQSPKLVLPQTTFSPPSASVMQVPRRRF